MHLVWRLSCQTLIGIAKNSIYLSICVPAGCLNKTLLNHQRSSFENCSAIFGSNRGGKLAVAVKMAVIIRSERHHVQARAAPRELVSFIESLELPDILATAITASWRPTKPIG